MRIAIIGAGSVGRALGAGWAAKGYEILFGLRDPSDAKYSHLKTDPATTLTTPRDAVKDAPVVVLAAPWAAARNAVQSCGPLAGKILVDCTNPVKADFSGIEDGPLSAAEQIAALASGARVVKCFNQTAAENMADSCYGSGKPIMFAAGDDAEAVRTVATLAQDLGFEAIAIHGLNRARQLEHLAWLYIDLAAGARAPVRLCDCTQIKEKPICHQPIQHPQFPNVRVAQGTASDRRQVARRGGWRNHADHGSDHRGENHRSGQGFTSRPGTSCARGVGSV